MIEQFAITFGRVSTQKQDTFGESLDDQTQQIKLAIERSQVTNNCTIKILKQFEFTQSASVSLQLQPLQQAITYCKSSDKPIKFCFLKSLDRATRGGAIVYGLLKMQLEEMGISLVDTFGIIQAQRINTMEHLGLSYKWSTYSPTFISELLEAERAKSEVRDIQTRMIGMAVKYIRLGYWRGSAPLGFVMERINCEHGRRYILKPDPVEAIWFQRMYQMAQAGNYTPQQICDDVNYLGFSTRTRKNSRGLKLTPKMLDRYLQNPLFAGVNNSTWCKDSPVKLYAGGLVSVDLWNKANKGRLMISESDGKITIYQGKQSVWQQKKNYENPEFAYRLYVVCPHCRANLVGGFCKGKSGRPFGYYFCNRKGHKYWGVSKQKLEDAIQAYCETIAYSPEQIENFRQSFIKNYQLRENQIVASDEDVESRLKRLQDKRQALMDKIGILSYVEAIRSLEQELIKVDDEITGVKAQVAMDTQNKIDLDTMVNGLCQLLEHLPIMLSEQKDPNKKAAIFGLLFEEKPTYEELVNRTPKLASLFELNPNKSTFVRD